jgi:hypothetical protein
MDMSKMEIHGHPPTAAAALSATMVQPLRSGRRSPKEIALVGFPLEPKASRQQIQEAILRNIYLRGFEYRKAGVMFTELVPRGEVQANLFDNQNRGRATKLMTALDSVNARFGSGTLQYASSGIARTWKTQFQRRSPAYTTDWKQLPLVS